MADDWRYREDTLENIIKKINAQEDDSGNLIFEGELELAGEIINLNYGLEKGKPRETYSIPKNDTERVTFVARHILGYGSGEKVKYKIIIEHKK
jgi:hypothetical protein